MPDGSGRRLQLAGVAGWLLALLLLVGGPDPRRANRWGWFWILSVGQSYGVGVRAFLLLGARRGPQDGELGERADGVKGFVVAFVAGLVLGIPFLLVHDQVVGDRHGPVDYTYDAPR